MFFSTVLALTAIYTAFGVVLMRRLRRPTCRVCLFLQSCPNRESEYSDPTRILCWSRGQTIACAESTPNREP